MAHEQAAGADGVITVKAERATDVSEAAASGAWWAFFNTHRIFNAKVNIAGVVPGSLVWVSLTECAPGGNIPFLGDATTHTYNVVPDNGFVKIRGEIDWDTDLLIRASLYIG
jgi:hypothetical protein